MSAARSWSMFFRGASPGAGAVASRNETASPSSPFTSAGRSPAITASLRYDEEAAAEANVRAREASATSA